MKIFERPDGKREGFAPLDNIGFCLLEVNLEGEVYEYGIPTKAEHCKAKRVGNKWKIRAYDDSLNCIEYVVPRDVLVGFAWYNIKESLWENSAYTDTIRRYKEFLNTPAGDIEKTDYKTSRGFYYYITKEGAVWSTENMIKLKGGVNSSGYLHVILGSGNSVAMHRLVAHHFVPKPKDLAEENLVVNHLDGNKLNNRWDNLEWTTQKGNVEHACINGLIPTIIDDQLLERIWQLLQAGYSDIDISKLTGIPVKTVSGIRQGYSPRYRTDKYIWPKHSPGVKVLDKTTIFNIYDEFTYTNKKNREIGRKYNVSDRFISHLRRGRTHSNLAREYITSKGLAGYWKGYNPPK